MKRIGLSALAAGLLLAATALAQPDRHGGGHPPSGGGGALHGGGMPHGGGMSHGGGMPHGGGGFGGGHAGFSRGAAPSRATGGFGGFERHTAPAGGSRDFERNSGFTGHAIERGGFERSGRVGPTVETGTTGHRGSTAGAPMHNGQANYSHDSRGFGLRPSNWNNRPRSFSRADYQHNVHAAHRFHYGSYQRPSGWYYRQWSYGDYLPAIFWARNYWINDWWMFDLPIPPYGYEWVRYGDDALLINVYTGEVLEADYGVFY